MLLYELGIFLGGFLSAHSQAPEDLPDDPTEESGAIVPAADHRSSRPGTIRRADTAAGRQWGGLLRSASSGLACPLSPDPFRQA